ncbi:Nuclear pore complex protein Nup54 [Cichlidogyrus casuarinus]|uniref:Nuclear pore complex protein Nup54 n=1 Tax=Cichlidogyrus casuarinus TaxID=1844966 RepID=A0ABD2QBJ5_9PLAT
MSFTGSPAKVPLFGTTTTVSPLTFNTINTPPKQSTLFSSTLATKPTLDFNKPSTLFTAPAQQQQQPAQTSSVEAFYSSLSQPLVLSDERDSIICKWNQLQAMYGTGVGYCNLGTVQYTQDNPFSRFKSIAFNMIPKTKDSDGLVRLSISRPLNELLPQQQTMKDFLFRQLGSKASFQVELVDIRRSNDANSEVVIKVLNRQSSANSVVVNASDLSQMAVTEVSAEIGPTHSELSAYLDTPPACFDKLIWQQFRLDNPEISNLLPVPLIGLSDLKQRKSDQTKFTSQQSETMKCLAQQSKTMTSRNTIIKDKLFELKRKQIELSHRILNYLARQEVRRKMGFAISSDEESLRYGLERLWSELLASPQGLRNRMQEILQNGDAFEVSVAAKLNSTPMLNSINSDTVSQLKEYLGQRTEQDSTNAIESGLKTIFVYTLHGQTYLLERDTGRVIWSRKYEPAVSSTYDEEGPFLIPDPIDGSLYEYSNPQAPTLISRLDLSLYDHVKRSPAHYRSLFSICSKTDTWHSLSFRCGKLNHKSTKESSFSCPSNLEHSGEFDVNDNLVVAQSHMTFTLRHPISGATKVNISYNTFVTQIETEDPDSDDYRHLCTAEENHSTLITFDKNNVLWWKRFDSPIVGLYSVWQPPAPVPSEQSNYTPEPKYLQHIPFSTFTLKSENNIYKDENRESLAQLIEETFANKSNTFKPSLFLGRSQTAALFAIRSITEAGVSLRPLIATSKSHLLEGPKGVADYWPTDHEMNHRISGLPGLYELPPIWSQPGSYPPRKSNSFHLSKLISYDQAPGLSQDNTTKIERTNADLVLYLVLIITSLILAILLYILIKGMHSQILPALKKPVKNNHSLGSSEDSSSSLLPVNFDNPNDDGVAGWFEGSEEERVLFNLNEPIGQGCDGTRVFSGSFGKHEAAVKRIVRNPKHEKQWLREHNILMQHQHPNLVRCFWTGSSPNFHYLAMQRCEFSLSDAVNHKSTLLRKWLPKNWQSDSSLADAWHELGILQMRVFEQLMSAVTYLHKNDIVHRDLKPSNVLFYCETPRKEFRLVVGDFGLSRPLISGREDFTNSCNHITASFGGAPNSFASGDKSTAFHAFGTLGWMAPELCDSQTIRLTPAVDLFACGLLAFFIFSHGRHPFDEVEENTMPENSVSSSSSAGTGSATKSNRAILSVHHNRQTAIINQQNPSLDALLQQTLSANTLPGSPDLKTVTNPPSSPFYEYRSEILLCKDLIEQLISFHPGERPAAKIIADSPLFWSSEKVMQFYCDISDFVDHKYDPTKFANHEEEVMYARQNSFKLELEHIRDSLFKQYWYSRLEQLIVDDLMARRGYDGTSAQHLLRAIRNKRNHFWSLSSDVKAIFGSDQSVYWNQRFPNLLPQLYRLSRLYLVGLREFRQYLPHADDNYRTLAAKNAHFDQVVAAQNALCTRKFAGLNALPYDENVWHRKHVTNSPNTELEVDEGAENEENPVAYTLAKKKTRLRQKKKSQQLKTKIIEETAGNDLPQIGL